jgi:hypothetical protein
MIFSRYIFSLSIAFAFCLAISFTAFCLDAMPESSLEKGVAAMLRLRNGQAANINLLDTSGSTISYERRGNTVTLRKELIEWIAIAADTINYSGYANEKTYAKPESNDSKESIDSSSSNPISTSSIAAKKIKSVKSTEYYADKAPSLIHGHITKGDVGNLLTFMGIGGQYAAIFLAQDLGPIPALTLLGASLATKFIGPRMAVSHYYAASEVAWLASDSIEQNDSRAWKAYRIGLGLTVAGGVASMLPLKIPFARWESENDASYLEFSVSLAAFPFMLASEIVNIANNQISGKHARKYARLFAKYNVAVAPIWKDNDTYGFRIIAAY